MGTVFTVVAYGRDSQFLAGTANEIFEEMDNLDEQLSNYKPQSELSRINREAAGGPVVVEPGLFRLLQESLHFSRDTDGAFDITVGPLMKTWGFFRGRGRVPTDSEILQVLKRTGSGHVRLDRARRTVRFNVAGVELDLGGVGKGYAVDRAAEILRSNGIAVALVSSGTSSIYALGAPPQKRGWKINIRNPLDPHKGADVVFLKNYSLSVSGNYERSFKVGEQVYSHILNPKTGRPVQTMLATAVLSPNAVDGDALSTAFFVLGVAGSRTYLDTHPNLTAIFYEPACSQSRFKRTVLHSEAMTHLPEALAEVESPGP